ncbi:MAG: hypothetical protein V1913_08280 [Fibrobacterota bacterium]
MKEKIESFQLRGLCAAAGSVDITDCADTTYSGFVRAESVVRDPVQMRMIRFTSANGDALWMNMDETNLPIHPTYGFLDRLSKKIDIPVSRIMLCQTHCHSGLSCYRIDWDRLLDLTAHGVAGLKGKERPVAFVSERIGLLPEGSIVNRRVAIGEGLGDTCVVFNTHCTVDMEHRALDAGGWVLNELKSIGACAPDAAVPAGKFMLNRPVDRRLHLWVLKDADKNPLAAVLRANAHPVMVSQKWVKNVISGDYPAVAMHRISSALGAPCLFINGAFGDTRPLQSEYSFAERDRFGALCAETVLAAPEQNVPTAELNGAFLETWIPVRADVGASPEEARRLQKECQTQGPATPQEKKKRKERLDVLKLTVEDLEKHGESAFLTATDLSTGRMPARFHAWRLGPMKLVTLPGEPFVKVASDLERATGALAVGVTDASSGYLPDVESFPRGGYEPTWCAFDERGLALVPEIAGRVAEQLK